MLLGQWLFPLLLLLNVGSTSDFEAITANSICTATADAGPDQTVCAPGGIVQLNGAFTGNVIGQLWTPPDGLSDPNILSPNANVTSTTTYTLTVFENDPLGLNLVLNGDFSLGNTGFSTDYSYVPDDPLSQLEMYPEGTYSIVTNPQLVHDQFAACGDHTGGGNMMVVNGAASFQDVWCQTVTVNPNTAYNFSAWVATVVSTSPAQLQFSINGVPIGNIFNAPSATCAWTPFNALWNSGGNSSAEICIINLNTQPSGNDFALDDILFTEICQATDEVTIYVLEVEAVIAAPDEINCNDAEECQFLDASASSFGPDVTYQWTASAGGTIISGANTIMPYVCGIGLYELTVSQTQNGTTCTDVASVFILDDNALPPFPEILGNPEPCATGLDTFWVIPNDAYANYIWSWPSGGILVAGQGTETLVLNLQNASSGDVCLIVENYCQIVNSNCFPIDIILPPDPPIISGPNPICADSQAIYVVSTAPLNTMIEWTVPLDATIVSGQNTSVLTVDWTGSAGGMLCVDITGLCGVGTACETINIFLPDTLIFPEITCIADSAGMDTVFLQNQNGCDSLNITIKTFVASDTVYATLPTCDPLLAGLDTLISPIPGGCFQVTITETIYVGSDPHNTFDSSCFPQDTGLFVIVHQNINDCDSIENHYVALLESSIEFIQDFTCNLSGEGVDTSFLMNQNGCDSLIVTTTTFVPSDTLFVNQPTCDISMIGLDTVVTMIPGGCFQYVITETVDVGSDPHDTFSSSCFPQDTGLFVIVHSNINNCDSIENHYVALLESSIEFIQDFTCDLSGEGIDTSFLMNQNGCDSLVVTTTTFVSSDTLFLTQPVCDSILLGLDTMVNTIPGGCFQVSITENVYAGSSPHNTFDASCFPQDTGLFIIVHPNINNCDSIENHYVALLESSIEFIQDFTCDLAGEGIDTMFLMNQNGCDSLVVTTTTFVSSDTLRINQPTCDLAMVGIDTTVVLIPGGCFQVVITETIFAGSDPHNTFGASCFPQDTGLFVIIHSNINNCDSIENHYVSLLESSIELVQAFTCDLAGEGIDTMFLMNQNGCDSLVVTTTSFVSSDTLFVTQPTCDISMAGLDTVIITIPGGCFQTTITEMIYVGSDPHDSFDTSCFPQDTGLFVIVHSNINNCDSIENHYISLLESSVEFVQDITCDLAGEGVDTAFFVNQNGCDSLIVTNTTFVSSDTLYFTQPTCDITMVGIDTVTNSIPGACFEILITETIYVGSDPHNTFATTCSPLDTGLFVIVHQNINNCDSIENHYIGLLESSIELIQDFTCFIIEEGVDTAFLFNQNGCDSLIVTTTTFISSDTLNVTQPTCDIFMAGIDTVITTIPGACFEMLITETIYVGSDPHNTFATTCSPQDTGLFVIVHQNSNDCDSIENRYISLLPSTWSLDTAFTCEESEVGLDTLTLTNQFGCDSLAITNTQLSDPNLCGIEAEALADDIGCFESEGGIFLTALLGEAPFNYQWEGPGLNPLGNGTILNLDEAFLIDGLVAGDYSITVTSAGGLSTVLLVNIKEDAPVIATAAITSDYGNFDIACAGGNDGSAEATVLSGGIGPYTFEWSTGQSGSKVEGLSAGQYEVSVMDSQGCLAMDTILLEEPEPVLLELTFSDPLCFGFNDGHIEISGVSGGVSPFQYEINGAGFTDNSFFGNLGSGVYEVGVQDANGCVSQDIVAINTPVPIAVELGQDTTIDLGDSIHLQAYFNIPLEALDTIAWDQGLCDGCTDPLVKPIITTSYSVSIADANGCQATDKITLFVRKDRNIYIPNAFSPNGDGPNDRFIVYAGKGVKRIVQMQIFDRWGELIYNREDFPPDEPAYGWDGTFRGEDMNPAVFAYWVMVEFEDGDEVLYKGDVTLIR